MTQREEILTKIMAIAKRNGFGISDEFFTEIPTSTWLQTNQDLYFSLVFTKDFAISFWGDGEYMEAEGYETDEKSVDLQDYDNPMAFLLSNRDNICIPVWQYHLTQMVLSPDPLLYMAQFLNERQ